MIYDLDGYDFEAFVVNKKRTCLVEFWAPWCGPSRDFFPALTKAAQHFGPRLPVVRLNVDENMDIHNRYGVPGTPTTLAFVDGILASTKVGSLPPTQLMAWCSQFALDDEPYELSSEILAITQINGKLQLVELLEDGTFHYLDEQSKLNSLLYKITFSDVGQANAVCQFEQMINDKTLKERDFQEFFEEYPNFILNDDYKQAHSHIVLERTEGNLIPDFMLEPVNQEYLCDILDIKTPNSKVLNLKKNRVRFSAAVFEGIAQLREYQAYFDDIQSREQIKRKYGLVAYRPRLYLVIGRRGNVDPFLLKRVRQDARDVVVQTFDDLLIRAKARFHA